MLRLLLALISTTALTPLPADDEPKPKTAESRLNTSTEEAREPAKDQPDHRYNYIKTYDPLWHDTKQGATFTGDGARFTVNFLPDDSDLGLVELDDALRAQLKLPAGRGLVAVSVREHSPAWQAGVRQNDVLLSLDDAPLAKPGDMDAKLKQAGEKPLTLAIIRKGAPVSLKVQPQVKVSLGPVEQEEAPTYWIGVSVSTLSPALRAQLDVPENQGLLVANVVESSPAAKSDLKANDVLLTVAGQPLNSQPALSEFVQKNGETPFEVGYLREGERRRILKLTPEKRKTGQTFKLGVLTAPRIGTTVVRPGVVQDIASAPWITNNGFVSGWTVKDVRPTPDASAKQLDEMAAEIKELHKSIDALRKALEDRK